MKRMIPITAAAFAISIATAPLAARAELPLESYYKEPPPSADLSIPKLTTRQVCWAFDRDPGEIITRRCVELEQGALDYLRMVWDSEPPETRYTCLVNKYGIYSYYESLAACIVSYARFDQMRHGQTELH